jgi:hypothetical protein
LIGDTDRDLARRRDMSRLRDLMMRKKARPHGKGKGFCRKGNEETQQKKKRKSLLLVQVT